MPFHVCGTTASTDGSEEYPLFEACVVGSQCSGNYCPWGSQTKLGRGHDDADDDPFASDVEADLAEDEAGIDDEYRISTLASRCFVYLQALTIISRQLARSLS